MKYLKPALLKFQALTRREQLMAVLVVIVVLSFLADLALFGPQRNKSKVLQQQIAQQKIELNALSKVIAETSSSLSPDGLSRERAERDDLRARLAQAESLIGGVAHDAPLSEVLRAMIMARPELTLLSLKTLPPEMFYRAPVAVSGAQRNAAQPTATAAQLSLYKHGVEVAVKGSYLTLLPYLQNLQHHPNRLFWANVKLEVLTYPEATLKMTIYTLSDRPESPLG